MSSSGEGDSVRENRVGEAVAWYYRASEEGRAPQAEDFLARFPDLRAELTSFLADKDAFERAVGPREAATDPAATLPPSQDSASDTLAFSPSEDPSATHGLGDSEPTQSGTLGTVKYFGDYELLSEIARGGMGVVFRARQVSLNREVALKMILSGQLASAADVARFRAEAEAAANLDHANVLPIYETGEHQSQQYFAMKLISGGSLAGKMSELAKDPRAAVALLAKVCRAVEFAHRRGILHRDLKPGNILLDGDGTPYVTDFGLAKKAEGDSNLTQSGAIVGTPSYMAPEQARAEKGLTTAVDVYALGAILYESIAGRPPFRGATALDTILQLLEKDAVDPRSLAPKADRDLAVIALKCLEKQPSKRYESAGALADDLERWLRGEAILARPVGRGERTLKWVKRNPAITALISLLVVALVVGGTSTVFYAIQSGRRAELAAQSADRALANEATANDRQEMLKDTLSVASYQQANALRLAGRPGWRSKSLELLSTAAELRRRPRDPNDNRVSMPPLADIRGEAVMALVKADVDSLGEIRAGWVFESMVSLDGRRAAKPYGGSSKQIELAGVEIIDLTTGRVVNRIPNSADKNPNWAISVKAMNGNGSLMAAALDNSIAILDSTTGASVATLKDPLQKDLQIVRVRFSPDGRRVAAACYAQNSARVIVWNLDEPLVPHEVANHPIQEADLVLMVPEEGLFGCLRFAPDSRRLSFISPGGKSIRVRELSDGKAASVDIPFPDGITAAEWHPTRPLMAAMVQAGRNKRKVMLWDLEKKAAGPTGDYPFDAPASIAFSLDGKWLAASSATENVAILGADDAVERFRIEEAAGELVRRLFWTADGCLVTAGMMENLRVWRPSADSSAIETVTRIKAAGGSASSSDGKWLAVFADSGKFQGDPELAKNADVNMLADLDAFSQVLRRRDTVVLIERSTGRQVQSWPVDAAETNSLQFSPDGRLLAAFTAPKIVVWDVASKKEIVALKPPVGANPPVWEAMSFDGEGRLLGSFVKRISHGPADKPATDTTPKAKAPAETGPSEFVVWDVLANKEVNEFGAVQVDGLMKLNFCSGGRNLLVSPVAILDDEDKANGPWDLYEIRTGLKLAQILPAAGKGLRSFPLKVNGRGDRCIVGSIATNFLNEDMFSDFTVSVHQLSTGAKILTLPIAESVALEAVDLSPDGQLLVRAAGRGYVEVWDISRSEMIFRWQPFEGKPLRDVAFTHDGDIIAIGKRSDSVPILRMKALRSHFAGMHLDW